MGASKLNCTKHKNIGQNITGEDGIDKGEDREHQLQYLLALLSFCCNSKYEIDDDPKMP